VPSVEAQVRAVSSRRSELFPAATTRSAATRGLGEEVEVEEVDFGIEVEEGGPSPIYTIILHFPVLFNTYYYHLYHISYRNQ
jgi:hypothetical protein